jgi:hypothetical protein
LAAFEFEDESSRGWRAGLDLHVMRAEPHR